MLKYRNYYFNLFTAVIILNYSVYRRCPGLLISWMLRWRLCTTERLSSSIHDVWRSNLETLTGVGGIFTNEAPGQEPHKDSWRKQTKWKTTKWIMASLHAHPSQVAAAGGKWPSFTPAGATRCQQSPGLKRWNCSLTWKRLHGFAGRSAHIFGKLHGYISPSASPPDCELHIQPTNFGPTDNQFQLRAEVSSAELWRPVTDGCHGPLKGL